jgi:hypothetical protein
VKEVSPHHFSGEASSLDAEDAHGGDCELLIVSRKRVPIRAVLHPCRPGMAELRKILFLDPTPFPAPLFPLLIGQPQKVGILIPGIQVMQPERTSASMHGVK